MLLELPLGTPPAVIIGEFLGAGTVISLLIYVISRHDKASLSYRIARRAFHIFAAATLVALALTAVLWCLFV